MLPVSPFKALWFLLAAAGSVAGQSMPRQFVTGSCSLELRSATIAIIGGVSASALKPTGAAAELDRRMDAFRKAVEKFNGRLSVLERVRAVIPAPGQYPAGERPPNFEIVQRVRAEFAPGAPVDSILDELILIGMDRFGDAIETNGGRQTGMPVRYVFTGFAGQMLLLTQKCQDDAIRQFCSQDDFPCKTAVPALTMDSFTAYSEEEIIRPNRSVSHVDWNEPGYPARADGDNLEVLGDIPLHMKGRISMHAQPVINPAAIFPPGVVPQLATPQVTVPPIAK